MESHRPAQYRCGHKPHKTSASCFFCLEKYSSVGRNGVSSVTPKRSRKEKPSRVNSPMRPERNSLTPFIIWNCCKINTILY